MDVLRRAESFLLAGTFGAEAFLAGTFVEEAFMEEVFLEEGFVGGTLIL